MVLINNILPFSYLSVADLYKVLFAMELVFCDYLVHDFRWKVISVICSAISLKFAFANN